MQLEIEELDSVRRRARIEVAAPSVDSAFSGAYNRIAQKAALPGFRKGRVPMSHLRKRYGRQVTSDVTNELLEKGFRALVDEHGLEPLGQPEVDLEPAKQGRPFVATLTFEVAPTVELLDPSSYAVEQEKWTASDAVVDHELEHLAERVAEFEDVTDREVAEDGDQVTLDYRGEIDEVPFAGGTASDATLELGSGRFIPGFEEQVVGQKVGEDFAIEVTFPEQYPSAELAGKAAVFHCTLKSIRHKVVPPIDDALAEKVGLEDLADLKTRVKADIEGHYNERSAGSAREALKAEIGEAYDFDVPPVIVEGAMSGKRNELLREAMQGGAEQDEARAKAEAGLEEHREGVLRDARAEIVLDQVATAENIEVPEHEVSAYIEHIIRQTGQFGDRFRQVYRDPNRRAGLRRQMRHDKVLDFLLTKANVTPIPKDVPAHDHGDGHDHDHEHDGHDHGSQPEDAAE